MKYFVKFFVVTFYLLFCTYSLAEEHDKQKIAYIDMKFVLNNSKAGKEAQDFLKNALKSSQKEFANKEKELKSEEANLLKQRSTLSKEAYKQKVDELREKLNKYQAQRKEILGKLTTQRAEARNKLIEKVNPIMEKYVNENKISLVLEKNVVLIGSTDSDITKIIVDRLNDELPSLSLK